MKSNVHDFSDAFSSCVFDLVMEKKCRVKRLQYYWNLQNNKGDARLRLTVGTPIFDAHGNIQYVINMMQDVASFQEQCETVFKDKQIIAMARHSKRQGSNEQPIVAESESFKNLLAIARDIAPLDSTVLIRGESGSGKEVIANYIHQSSSRGDKPMISLNCAAFPENLIETELFGYEKGAFTGANQAGKMGMIEAAHGSTLFLDEINSLPLSAQGKLLRTLEDKYITRIGSTTKKKIDFRLIVATNQDLRQLVKKGLFREDLYYRLQVVPLTIPPIRSRKEDLLPLCQHFMEYFCNKYNIRKSLSPHAEQELLAYDWPGNVREIRNFAERLVVMTPQTTERIDSVASEFLFDAEEWPNRGASPPSQAGHRTASGSDILGSTEILSALEECDYKFAQAAESLGISKRYLQGLIKKYHLEEFAYQKSLFNRESIQMALESCNKDRAKTARMLGITQKQLQSKIQEYHLEKLVSKRVTVDKQDVLAALAQCPGDRNAAAKLLGISRRQLQYKIKEFHLSPRCKYDSDAD